MWNADRIRGDNPDDNSSTPQLRKLLKSASPTFINQTRGDLSFQTIPFGLVTNFNETAQAIIMHLILTGGTGMVGSGVLDAMIKMKSISKISILSRRPVKMAEDSKDSRINVIIHKDFEKYDTELLEHLKGASGCVWALGTAQSQVSKELSCPKHARHYELGD
jgi:hypothetical protein